MATIDIVPAGEAAEEQVHLLYEGDVSMSIKELPDVTLVTVVDTDGTEIVFADPASYSFSEFE